MDTENTRGFVRTVEPHRHPGRNTSDFNRLASLFNTPFQIIDTVVQLVAVNVVDLRQGFRIRQKLFCNQPMNCKRLPPAVVLKFN